MNYRNALMGGILAVAVLAAARPAYAANTPPGTAHVVPTSNMVAASDVASDRNIKAQGPILDKVLDVLQNTRMDYSGHRASAIQYINQARQELRLALQTDRLTEEAGPSARYVFPESAEGNNRTPQDVSNDRLAWARNVLDRVIDNLNADNHDYGGHRAKAVQLLHQARQELASALASVGKGEDFDRDFMPGGVAAASRLVDRSIALLNNAKSDYGGHRFNAVNALKQAQTDLAAAMKTSEFRESEEASEQISVAQQTAMAQASSDENVRDALFLSQRAANDLQNAPHDYGGYRAKALADVRRAISEMNQALATR